jgi:hypothetical protein
MKNPYSRQPLHMMKSRSGKTIAKQNQKLVNNRKDSMSPREDRSREVSLGPRLLIPRIQGTIKIEIFMKGSETLDAIKHNEK